MRTPHQSSLSTLMSQVGRSKKKKVDRYDVVRGMVPSTPSLRRGITLVLVANDDSSLDSSLTPISNFTWTNLGNLVLVY